MADNDIAEALVENPIDQNAAVPILDKLDMPEYNRAREEGVESVEHDGPPPEVTGKESMKEYREKRDEQDERRGKGGGAQKRIDRLTKKNWELREKLAKYEGPGALESRAFGRIAERKAENGNGAARQEQSHEQESPPAGSEPEDARIPAMRERYPEWDKVMTRAKNENFRISDEAARVMHASENAGHISYLLASDQEFRTAFNKLSPNQQVQEMHKIDGHISIIESGGGKFKESVESSLSPSELAEVRKAITTNRTGALIVVSLMKEINSLPNGPAVFKQLITNPQTSERLAGMSQAAASMELGRMSARLEGGNQTFKSNAPAPISPVGNGSTASSVPLDQMSMKDFRKAREAGRVR